MNYSLDSTYLAAKECIAHGIPFALCFKPGVSIDQTPEFYVENPNVGLGYKELNSLDFESFNGFVVSPFDINTHQRIFGIKDEISSKDILRYFAETPAYRKYNNFHFKYNSTIECDHKHAVEQVSRSFKSDSEKTVGNVKIELYKVNNDGSTTLANLYKVENGNISTKPAIA